MDLHELAERRSLAIHRVIAQRLLEDPSLLEKARGVLLEWMARGVFGAAYADAWERWLNEPAAEVARLLSSDTEEARALRQTSPFVGIVSQRERSRIWRTVREECGR